MLSRSSTIRHRTINHQGPIDPKVRAATNSVLRNNPRASRTTDHRQTTNIPQTEQEASYYPNYRANRYTVSRPTPTQSRATAQQQARSTNNNTKTFASTNSGNKLHWLVPIGVALIILVLSIFFVGTVGASFYVDHFTSDNGPTHGSTLSFTPKAGAHQEQIIGVNLNGKVDVFIVPDSIGNTKIYAGIDLIQAKFPNATHALVILSEGDYNQDGKLDIQVKILSDVFPTPFYRVTASYFLLNDGNGNFRQTTAIIG